MTADAAVDLPRPLRRRWPGGRRLRDGHHLYWWVEILAVVVFYVFYSTIRNLHHGDPTEAFEHARELMRWQIDLGINHEQAIQDWALGFRPFIVAANYFYGSLHFIVTGGVMIYLYRKWSDDYPLWRNTLAVATGLALIGFALFPLMPPRLLDPYCVHHAALQCAYGFRDTLAEDPAFWSFNTGAVSKISNQYAAMPSVHCAWALWCACVIIPRVKHTWTKVLAALYPVATVTVIVVTANHYFLDAPAGFLSLGIAYATARLATRAGRGAAQPASAVAATAHEPTDDEAEGGTERDHDDERHIDAVEDEVDVHRVEVHEGEHQ